MISWSTSSPGLHFQIPAEAVAEAGYLFPCAVLYFPNKSWGFSANRPKIKEGENPGFAPQGWVI
jgi:hypothetical protein